MRDDNAGRALCAALLLMLAPLALGHHSFAMFDQTRLVTLRGTLRELQWTNPHAFLHVVVRDAAGEVEWHVELNSPNNLRRQGWDPRRIKAGEPITVEINPLRDGAHGGLFVSAKLSDGTVLGQPGGGGPVNVPGVN
jgi:hypothetical protein